MHCAGIGDATVEGAIAGGIGDTLPLRALAIRTPVTTLNLGVADPLVGTGLMATAARRARLVLENTW